MIKLEYIWIDGNKTANQVRSKTKVVNSSDWDSLITHVVSLSKFSLAVAMSAIGLSTDMKSFKSIGIKVFYFGFVISFLVGLLSLVLIFLLIK